MAIATAYDASGGINLVDININDLAHLTWISNTSTSAIGDLRSLGLSNVQYEFNGSGFAYDATGFPTAGTITRIAEKLNGQLTFDIQNTSIPVPTFTYWVLNNLTLDAINYIFSGHDTLNGSNFADLFAGQGGSDLMFGNGGNDYLLGSLGNDSIDGGAGSDLAAYVGGESDYHIVTFGGTTAVLPESLSSLAAGDGIDKLISVESLGFLNDASGRNRKNIRSHHPSTSTSAHSNTRRRMPISRRRWEPISKRRSNTISIRASAKGV